MVLDTVALGNQPPTIYMAVVACFFCLYWVRNRVRFTPLRKDLLTPVSLSCWAKLSHDAVLAFRLIISILPLVLLCKILEEWSLIFH